ncbi:MAG: DUF2273 domain-containing protein [Limnochordales bacterium]|nr:DUF2273 domain-containing protein [Limnochordales bacterium]
MELWRRRRGRLVGSIVGLFFGLVVIIFGFVAGLFLFACTLAGYAIGRRIDEEQDILGMIQRVFHPRSRDR